MKQRRMKQSGRWNCIVDRVWSGSTQEQQSLFKSTRRLQGATLLCELFLRPLSAMSPLLSLEGKEVRLQLRALLASLMTCLTMESSLSTNLTITLWGIPPPRAQHNRRIDAAGEVRPQQRSRLAFSVRLRWRKRGIGLARRLTTCSLTFDTGNDVIRQSSITVVYSKWISETRAIPYIAKEGLVNYVICKLYLYTKSTIL